jgi:hypothetical protein
VNLIDAEKGFRAALGEAGVQLEAAYEALMAHGEISLDGTDLTKAVLLRVGAFYEFQQHAKRTLGTGAIGSGAYFFADSVFLYLKAVLATRQVQADVQSERLIHTAAGRVKPDMSLWSGETCVAAIECKTQMGFRRNQWEQDFIARQDILSRMDPPAEVYLVSLTNRGGPRDLETSELLGDRYFILARDWPTNKSEREIEHLIWTPLEDLFKALLALVRRRGLTRGVS